MPHTTQRIYIVFLTFSTIVMVFLFRHDWNRLAKLYRTKEAPPQNFSRMQNGSVGLVIGDKLRQ